MAAVISRVYARAIGSFRFIKKAVRYLLLRRWPYLKYRSELAFGKVIRAQTLHPSGMQAVVGAILRRLRIKVLFNLVPGLGHNTVELDQLFRLQALGVINPKGRIILARSRNYIHEDTLSLYGNRFWYATSNTAVRFLIEPAAAGAPDLHIDSGLSRLKWNYDPSMPLAVPFGGQTYVHQISKAENVVAWRKYYEIRRQTSKLFPLRDGIGLDQKLEAFLGGMTKPLAVVHIKNHVANATAEATDPAAYVPAIEYLQGQGYVVAQVGREPMPEVFAHLGVINYAESTLASYRHDLQIFAAAKLAITAGSGIATLADCMGTPLLYVDSWHIAMPMASDTCVMVPALVLEKARGQMMSFKQQLNLYLSLEDSGPETFPRDKYVGRNAEADEILAGIKELESLVLNRADLSPLQQQYRDIDRGGLMEVAGARVSDYFIQKHAGLLKHS